jgi:hypothetical protein
MRDRPQNKRDAIENGVSIPSFASSIPKQVEVVVRRATQATNQNLVEEKMRRLARDRWMNRWLDRNDS